ncbi:MalY/PatB family protein [Campylobacter sp. RM16188]|uniref:MalY/PatB family protein n=1 Tax=Campylobacter sp. RM16188 TaxID=1705725 RepID=UPI001553E2E6|nr:MalY/PatB family protein [Campylobacter sp. RM16188]
MRYDFDKVINRRGLDSVKWSCKEDELPMWVADMDFECAPEILAALQKRLDHGVFGYPTLTAEWQSSICSWWSRRHKVDFKPEWLISCSAVVPAIASIIRKFSCPGDKILVQSPVYHAFFNIIINNGRQIADNKLIYNSQEYEIDFIDLENKLKDPLTRIMLLCNPHNPIGKIWSKAELEKIAKLCYENDVLLVSDEIHCDIVDPKLSYTPMALIEEYFQNCITCISPSKSFNIAGIQGAMVVTPNENLKDLIKRAFDNDKIAENNIFSAVATIASYNESEVWLDELREYIYTNKILVREFLQSEIPIIKLVHSTATYLLWLDCSQICDDSSKLQKFLRSEFGLWVSEGGEFGGNGKQFLRMNIACPKELLKDGLSRLKKGINAFINSEKSQF